VDRIILNGYFRMAYTSGGFLTWWNDLFPERTITQAELRRMAGDFSRRLHAYAKGHRIPAVYCPPGDKDKHAKAEALIPRDPNFQGLFLIQVSKAPVLV
jgi:hypothetical protein